MIETNPNNHKGWKKYYGGPNKYYDKSRDEDTISIQSESGHTHYNEWDSPEDYLTTSLRKDKNNYRNAKRKRYNQYQYKNQRKVNKIIETTISQKTDKSNTSMASDLTK